MKRILVLFIFLGLTSIFSLTGCNSNQTETGSFNNMSIESDKYILSIKSTANGHPSNGNAFSTSVKIENKIYKGDKYSVWYNIDYSYIKENSSKKDFPNISSYKKITINNKKFKYIINKSDITLIYQPDNMNCYITIKIALTDVFDKNGNYADGTFNISINDLLLKQIKGTLNFDIKKK